MRVPTYKGLCYWLHCLIVAVAVMAVGVPAQASEIDAASPEQLVRILKANVYLTGNIVKRLAAQKRLERLGKRDPQAVVPLIIKELAAPKTYGKIATRSVGMPAVKRKAH